MSVAGVKSILELERLVRKRNRSFEFAGVLINDIDERRVLSRQLCKAMKEDEAIGPRLLETRVPNAVSVPEAFYPKVSVFDLEDRSGSAKVRRQMRLAADEILGRLGYDVEVEHG